MGRSFDAEPETGVKALRCVWCDGPMTPWTTRTFQGPVYLCACGAWGLLAPPYDFDEAADELLEHLDVDAVVAAPARPVGSSGMLTARPYDAVAARRGLAEILAGAGYETRTEELELIYLQARASGSWTMKWWALWWRPVDPRRGA